MNLKRTSIFLIALSAATLQPRQSQAIIGFATADAGLIVGGIAMLAPGALYAFAGAATHSSGMSFLGDMWLLGGLVALDAHTVSFAALTPATSRLAYPLSPPELEAYNSNLEEINAVGESVSYDMRNSGTQTLEFSRNRWKLYGIQLDAEAFSAAQKICASSFVKGSKNANQAPL